MKRASWTCVKRHPFRRGRTTSFPAWVALVWAVLACACGSSHGSDEPSDLDDAGDTREDAGDADGPGDDATTDADANASTFSVVATYCAAGQDGPDCAVGPLPLAEVTIDLLGGGVECESLLASPSLDAPLSDNASLIRLTIPTTVDATIWTRTVQLPADLVPTTIVARGRPVGDAEGNPGSHYATWGCTEDLAAGSDVVVAMRELWPDAAGAFTTRWELPLLDALDPTGPVATVARFLEDPGFGLLSMVGASGGDASWWDEEPWSLTVVPCEDGGTEVGGASNPACRFPGDIAATAIGQAVAAEVAASFEAGVAALPGAQPDFTAAALAEGLDVFADTERVTLGGSLEIAGPSDARRDVTGAMSVALNTLTIRWADFDFSSQLDGIVAFDVAPMHWSARSPEGVPVYEAAGVPFDVQVPTGDVVFAIFEHIVLPAFVGSNIASLEDLVSSTVDCEAMGAAFDNAGVPGAGLAEARCDALVDTGSGALAGWRDAVVADSEVTLRLEAPPGAPCPVSLSDAPVPFRVDGLGADGTAGCALRVEIRPETAASVDGDGSWTAVRID